MTEDKRYWLERDFVIELLKQLPAHVFWKDTKSIYLGCNDTFAKALGLSSPADIIGKSDYDLPTTKKESDAFRKDDKEVMISGKPKLNIEEKQTLPNGKEIILLTNKVPLFDRNNKVIGILGIYNDITDKKNAEKFKIEKKLAEKKEHYVRIAAGTIAHDLRTPLSSIKFAISAIGHTFPQLLDIYRSALEQGQVDKTIRPSKLKALQSAVERCQNEIDFSQNYIDMILGNLKYDAINTDNYQMHNILKIVNDSLDTYPYRQDEKELLHWTPKVDFDFWGNDFYLKNVLNNLLKNAYFFIKKNQRGEIFITTEKTEKNYILTFKDTAQGAPPEVIDEMFEGYFSKREGGTGLGLAFCKSIMKSFGGDITANSVEGEFMEFILNFPQQSPKRS